MGGPAAQGLANQLSCELGRAAATCAMTCDVVEADAGMFQSERASQ